jgi:hypothetical protein
VKPPDNHRSRRHLTGTKCPSAPPEWEDSKVLGVVGGSPDEPRLRYLAEALPVTQELLGQAAPVTPTEVFRFTAACAETECVHFRHRECTLVSRIVALIPPVVDALPPCTIRDECRWWLQEGAVACHRCPVVVTDYYGSSERFKQAASGVMARQPGTGNSGPGDESVAE